MPSFEISDASSTVSTAQSEHTYVSRSLIASRNAVANQPMPYWMASDGSGKCVESVVVGPKTKFIAPPAISHAHIYALVHPATPGDESRLWTWSRSLDENVDIVKAHEKRIVGVGAVGLCCSDEPGAPICIVYADGSMRMFMPHSDLLTDAVQISSAEGTVTWHDVQMSGPNFVVALVMGSTLSVAVIARKGIVVASAHAQVDTSATFALMSDTQAVAALSNDGTTSFYQLRKSALVSRSVHAKIESFSDAAMEFVTQDFLVIASRSSTDAKIVVIDTRTAFTRAQLSLPECSNASLSIRGIPQARGYGYLVVSVGDKILSHAIEFTKPSLFDAIASKTAASSKENVFEKVQNAAELEQALEEIKNTKAVVPLLGTLESEPSLPSNVVQQAVRLVLDEKKTQFYDSSLLSKLILTDLVSSKAVPDGLVKALIKRKECWLLHLSLKHVVDLSERDVVKILAFFLTSPEADSEIEEMKCIVNLETETGSVQETGRDFYIRSVITSSYSSTFLARALRNLSAAQVKRCLEFSLFWMTVFTSVSESQVVEIADEITFAQILDFTTCLLDAHLTTILLDTLLHDILARLTNLIREQVLVCSQMETMHGVLREAEKSCRQQKHAKRAMNDKEISRLCGTYGVERIQWW